MYVCMYVCTTYICMCVYVLCMHVRKFVLLKAGRVCVCVHSVNMCLSSLVMTGDNFSCI